MPGRAPGEFPRAVPDFLVLLNDLLGIIDVYTTAKMLLVRSQ